MTKDSLAVNGMHLSLLDQIRAIALEGLKYAKDSYDIARYEKLLELAATDYSRLLDMDMTVVLSELQKEIGTATPKIGTDAAVINEKNELLILQRSDNRTWCLPCGWLDVGESPSNGAVRETYEETGLLVEPLYYIGLTHKGPHACSGMVHQVNTITLMQTIASDAPVKLSHEHTNYRCISTHDETLPWHPGMQSQVKIIFDFLSSDRRHYLPILVV